MRRLTVGTFTKNELTDFVCVANDHVVEIRQYVFRKSLADKFLLACKLNFVDRIVEVRNSWVERMSCISRTFSKILAAAVDIYINRSDDKPRRYGIVIDLSMLARSKTPDGSAHSEQPDLAPLSMS